MSLGHITDGTQYGSSQTGENGNLTAARAIQWRSNQVSGASLPKTGIFAVAAGDFRHIGLGFSEFGSLETVQQIAKARQL
jgi:hypothetical protein